ncbi:MAG: renalase [Polyangiales bacterium]|jgi:renalase
MRRRAFQLQEFLHCWPHSQELVYLGTHTPWKSGGSEPGSAQEACTSRLGPSSSTISARSFSGHAPTHYGFFLRGSAYDDRCLRWPRNAPRTRVMDRASRFAVVGAGIAGLACARRLHEAGLETDVFDKGRAPGGRICTKVEDDRSWDHGAQFIRARGAAFREQLAAWERAEVLGPWENLEGSHLGLPSMRALGVAMTRGLNVMSSTTVTKVEPGDGGYTLWGRGHGENMRKLGWYERVVMAVPAQQAVALVRELAEPLAAVKPLPCWALLLTYEAKVDLPAVLRGEEAFGFVQCESRKPGRDESTERWVVHMSAEWSQRHLELSQEEALAAALPCLPTELQTPSAMRAHRWRYASLESWVGESFVEVGGVSACGDGLLGPRVELAWESGDALGRHLRE